MIKGLPGHFNWQIVCQLGRIGIFFVVKNDGKFGILGQELYLCRLFR